MHTVAHILHSYFFVGAQILLPYPIAGVADRISWACQCEAKAVAVNKAVDLLLGQYSSSTLLKRASLSKEAAMPQETAAAAALRNCLGVGQELLKELQHFRDEVFSDWQVKAWGTHQVQHAGDGSC